MAKAKPQAEQLSFGLIVLDPQAHRLQAMQKTRRCLSCSSTFSSAGPGNRICGTCRSSDAFRSSSIAECSINAAAF